MIVTKGVKLKSNIMREILVMTFILFVTNTFSQENKIYVFKDRYNKSEQKYIENDPSRFSEIKVMTANSLLTNRKIDYRKVEESLQVMYPSNNATGVLCIDLENDAFKHLKGHNINRVKKMTDAQFEKAKNDFIELIRFIKNKRPKLQVGYFELPFRIFKESEQRPGSTTLLDDILKEADIIMPSLYIPYPASHVGVDANLKFLDINLKFALQCGVRLNKPVLPFVWYFIFSPEEKFSYEIIPKDDMNTYMDYIFNYAFNNKKVNGIIWWDSAVPFYDRNKGMVKQNYIQRSQKRDNINRRDLFYYYFEQ